MGLREHVLDQLTGPDIPVRYVVFFHRRDPLITEAFSLTDTLHDRECQATLYPFTNKVDHDVISGTDGSGNGCFSFLDQHLCIAKPYVCTMGKSRNTDQV